MSDEKIKVTDPFHVQPVFVNQVIGSGHLNSVVNVTLGTALFTPNADGEIEIDMAVSCRLRMDIVAAQQLRDNLDELLKKILPEAGEKLN